MVTLPCPLITLTHPQKSAVYKNVLSPSPPAVGSWSKALTPTPQTIVNEPLAPITAHTGICVTAKPPPTITCPALTALTGTRSFALAITYPVPWQELLQSPIQEKSPPNPPKNSPNHHAASRKTPTATLHIVRNVSRRL